MNKIFGIGLSHTATKSLNQALEILKIPSVHWPVDRQTYRELSQGQYNLTILKKYDAITDITASAFYAQLDRAYPNSKFILTIREKSAWMNSMRKINRAWLKYANRNFLIKYTMRFLEDFPDYKWGAVGSTWFRMRHDKPIEFMRIATYGGIAFANEERLSYIYDLHHQNILSYFKDRPNCLLVMDITKGDGWEKLCAFLSLPIPAETFPWVFDKRRHSKTDEVLKK